MSKYDDELL